MLPSDPTKQESEKLKMKHKSAISDAQENQESEHSNHQPQTRIKRPPNSYWLFWKANRERIGKERGTNVGITAACGELWKSMSDEEKAPYEAESKKLRMDFDKAHPGHKFQSKKRRPKRANKIPETQEEWEIERQKDPAYHTYLKNLALHALRVGHKEDNAETLEVTKGAGKVSECHLSNQMHGNGKQQVKSLMPNQYNPTCYQRFQYPTGQSTSSAVPFGYPTNNYHHNPNFYQQYTQFAGFVAPGQGSASTSATCSSYYPWTPESAVSSLNTPLNQYPPITSATYYNRNLYQHPTQFAGYVAPEPTRSGSMESVTSSSGSSAYRWNPQSAVSTSTTSMIQPLPITPAVHCTPHQHQQPRPPSLESATSTGSSELDSILETSLELAADLQLQNSPMNLLVRSPEPFDATQAGIEEFDRILRDYQP